MLDNRLNESPELIAQEWSIRPCAPTGRPGLNESPELIAQEFAGPVMNRYSCILPQ